MSSILVGSSSVPSSIFVIDNAEGQKTTASGVSATNSIADSMPQTELLVQQPTRQELEDAIAVMNSAAAIQKRALSFSIDDASGREVIKVVDFKTAELIRQIPSEELLKVAQDVKRLQQEMGRSIGLLVNSQA